MIFDLFKDTVDAICPNCGEKLIKYPKAKTICKYCKKPIYVRTHYQTKKKFLLTQAQLKNYEAEISKHYSDKRTREVLERNGITNSDLEDVKKHLTQRFGKEPSLSDIAWGAFNRRIIELGKMGEESLHELSILYFDMAMFLYNEGKDPSRLLLEAHTLNLKELKNLRFNQVRVSSAGGCASCIDLEDKIFNIDEALKKTILPSYKCTFKLDKNVKYSWCRCLYVAELDTPSEA